MVEWVPKDPMVNQMYYIEVLTKLRGQVQKKRLDLWKNNVWILHQDNTPAHNTVSVRQFLAGKQTQSSA